MAESVDCNKERNFGVRIYIPPLSDVVGCDGSNEGIRKIDGSEVYAPNLALSHVGY
jgi:hypothetical protein